MNVYAESSAVLAWLLSEAPAATVRQILSSATLVITSDFTLIECDRTLWRAEVLGEITAAGGAQRRAQLATESARWHVLRITTDIVDRARQPFPGDLVRTLDAIHLASLLVARQAVPGIDLLSLDQRVRRGAQQLGIHALPDPVF